MTSKKKSARTQQKQAFFSQLGGRDNSFHTGGIDSTFSKEKERQNKTQEKKEAALRHKACERKNRYSCKSDAEEAIRSCAEYSNTKLYCYRCNYCKGWHLTSKQPRL